MNKLLFLLPLLAACSPSFTGPAKPSTSSTAVQPAANYQTVTLGGKTYHLAEAKSYPLIDYWSYTLPSETKTSWTRRVDINRYKKVNAAEIFDQMNQATTNQLQTIYPASSVVCFVTEKEDGVIREANAWRYADVGGKTYGTGIIWKYRAGEDFNRFMKGEFARACAAMQTQSPVTPPSLSK